MTMPLSCVKRRFTRQVLMGMVFGIGLVISVVLVNLFFGSMPLRCGPQADTDIRLTGAVAALRRAARKTFGTRAHSDVTDALDKVLAIVGDSPTPVRKTSVSHPKHLLDVCPEKYLGTVYNYPYHETSRPLQNCTNARSFHTVLALLLNGFDYDSDVDILKLLQDISYAYPSLTVHVAVPKRLLIPTTMALDAHQHVLSKATINSGGVWNRLAMAATTDYVIVGRQLRRFSWYARLERMVRLLSEHEEIDVVGGAVRTPDGHWHMGCYQSTMRNYTLSYKDGYRASLHSCAYCDYLLSPFVVRTSALRKTQMHASLPSTVVFADLFLRLTDSKNTVMSCPDVMFYVSAEADVNIDALHRDWLPVVRERVLNRVVFPDRRGELTFPCQETGTSCRFRPGVILPICCIKNIVQIIRDVMTVCDKIGMYCQLDSGTAMGALKFNGILPWELDADILYLSHNRTSFWYHQDEFAQLGYRFSLIYPSKCRQFDPNNYRCLHFDVSKGGFRLELFGDLRNRASDEFPKEEVLLPTKMQISGLWLNAPRNPGLTLHNRYGSEILKHVEHWRVYGKSTSFDLYKSGVFKTCPNPGMHYCLDRYLPDGSDLEYQNHLFP